MDQIRIEIISCEEFSHYRTLAGCSCFCKQGMDLTKSSAYSKNLSTFFVKEVIAYPEEEAHVLLKFFFHLHFDFFVLCQNILQLRNLRRKKGKTTLTQCQSLGPLFPLLTTSEIRLVSRRLRANRGSNCLDFSILPDFESLRRNCMKDRQSVGVIHRRDRLKYPQPRPHLLSC